MRITTGLYKNRRLFFPKDKDIRPAMDKVRQCIFNVLGASVEGSKVLDLFAGCGSLSFEALSRGAHSVSLVDRHRLAISSINKNIDLLKVENQVTLYAMDIQMALRQIKRNKAQFDLIFLDPPYNKDFIRKTLRQVCEFDILRTFGCIVLEHSKEETPGELSPEYRVEKTKKFGGTYLSFIYRKERENEGL